jgi:hypothetical protein
VLRVLRVDQLQQLRVRARQLLGALKQPPSTQRLDGACDGVAMERGA